MQENGTRDIYFVYLGKALPKYVLPSIALAQRYSGLRVHLIADTKTVPAQAIESIEVVNIGDFYKPDEFNRLADKVSSSHTFRSGFWLRTFERFFVLEQLMTIQSLPNILHAELDQLLFNVKRFADNLEVVEQRGMFLPFHDASSAVASIFFCNDASSIRDLIDFASISPEIENEMKLIARFGRSNPSKVHALPTLSSESNPAFAEGIYPISSISSEELGGVVDAAQIGQWVAGIDPRNVPPAEVPVTKFVDLPNPMLLARQNLEEMRFTLSSDGSLTVSAGSDGSFRLFNLHIHSKIHGHLHKNDSSLVKLIASANSSLAEKIPGTRKMQLVDFFQTAARRFFRLTLFFLSPRSRKKTNP